MKKLQKINNSLKIRTNLLLLPYNCHKVVNIISY